MTQERRLHGHGCRDNNSLRYRRPILELKSSIAVILESCSRESAESDRFQNLLPNKHDYPSSKILRFIWKPSGQ